MRKSRRVRQTSVQEMRMSNRKRTRKHVKSFDITVNYENHPSMNKSVGSPIAKKGKHGKRRLSGAISTSKTVDVPGVARRHQSTDLGA